MSTARVQDIIDSNFVKFNHYLNALSPLIQADKIEFIIRLIAAKYADSSWFPSIESKNLHLSLQSYIEDIDKKCKNISKTDITCVKHLQKINDEMVNKRNATWSMIQKFMFNSHGEKQGRMHSLINNITGNLIPSGRSVKDYNSHTFTSEIVGNLQGYTHWMLALPAAPFVFLYSTVQTGDISEGLLWGLTSAIVGIAATAAAIIVIPARVIEGATAAIARDPLSEMDYLSELKKLEALFDFPIDALTRFFEELKNKLELTNQSSAESSDLAELLLASINKNKIVDGDNQKALLRVISYFLWMQDEQGFYYNNGKATTQLVFETVHRLNEYLKVTSNTNLVDTTPLVFIPGTTRTHSSLYRPQPLQILKQELEEILLDKYDDEREIFKL